MDKKIFIIFFALLVVAGVAVGASFSPERVATPVNQMTPVQESAIGTPTQELISVVDHTGQKQVDIDIKEYQFIKQHIKIKKGTIVTWTNRDSVEHNAFSDNKAGPTGTLLKQGEAYSFTFNTLGKIDYYCVPHPSMQATVEVIE